MKRKSMKRITALIIAAIMIVSMIPVAAVETETPAAELTYEYKFSRASHGIAEGTGTNSNISQATVDGTVDGYDKWGYVNLTEVEGNVHNLRTLSREDTPWDVYWTYPKTNGWEYNPGAGQLPPALTLEIVIDKPGTYTPKFSYTTSRHAPIVDIYLVKAPTDAAEVAKWKTTEEGQAAYKEKLSNLGTTAEFLGSVDMYDNASSGFLRSNELNEYKIKEAGSYYLVIVPNGAHSSSRLNSNGNNAQIFLSSLSLTGIPDDTKQLNYEYKLSQASHNNAEKNLTTGTYTVENTAAGYDKWGYVNLTAVDGDVHNMRAKSSGDEPWDVYWTYPKENGWEYNPAAGQLPPALTLEIVIDEPGAFTPKLSYTTSRNGPIVDLYLVKAPTDAGEVAKWKTTEEGQAAYKEKLSNLGTTAKFLGSVDMYDNASNGFWRSNELGVVKISEQGSYYLVLVPNGANSGSRLNSTGSTAQIYPTTFSLTGTELKLDSVSVTAEKKYVLLDDADGMKLSPAGTYNSGDAVDFANDGVNVTYTSSNEDVATVTADGVVMPKKVGKTIITAAFTMGNDTKNAKTTIVVSEEPIYDDIELNFNYTGLKNGALVTATLASQGWALNRTATDAALVEGYNIQHNTVYGILMQSEVSDEKNTAVIDFTVSEDAAYDIKLQHYKSSGGGIGYVYVDGVYAGEVDFYSAEDVMSVTSLRSFKLKAGETHTLTFVAAENGAGGSANMYPSKVTLEGMAEAELAGISSVEFEAERNSIAVGETEPYKVYAVQTNGFKFVPRAKLDGTEEVTITNSDATVAELGADKIKGIKAGPIKITVAGALNETQVNKEFDFTVNTNTYAEAEINVADTLIEGATTEVSVSAYLSDETRINDRDISYTLSVAPANVAELNGNVLSLKTPGTATITAVVTFNGAEQETATKEIQVVAISPARIEANISEPVVSSFSKTGSKININVINNDGSSASIEGFGAECSYESLTPETVSVTADGYIKYVSKGAGTVKVTAKIGDDEFTYDLEVVSSSLKTESTLITKEMAQNAKGNVAQYKWAKDKADPVIERADYYVANLDAVYNLVTYEGIPRSYKVSNVTSKCPYCGATNNDNGKGAWAMDPLNSPWKVRCISAACQRQFPSNDFGEFYKLGLDQKGQFDRMRALEAHREKFVDKTTSPEKPGTEWSADWCAYYGYGLGYLKNNAYPEVGDTLSVAADKVATWAVDDGFGWHSGGNLALSDGKTAKYTFIPYYYHYLFSDMRSSHDGARDDLPYNAVNCLYLAYVYTGDLKYGRAGAIMVDRFADVYPSYDLNQYGRYSNSHGGRRTGKILGSIWETYVAKALIHGYDALYEVMDDPQVIDYLSKKAAEFGLENPKTTGDMIRENCETGILREAVKAVKSARIDGNFPMHQEIMTYAGIALDTYPESEEIFKWISLPEQATVYVPYPQAGYEFVDENGNYVQSYGISVKKENLGGGVLQTVIGDVDRDGFGGECAANYNAIWLANTLNLAEAFYRYGKYSELNLYENPKYKSMLSALLNMTVGSGYTLQLGDDGETAGTSSRVNTRGALIGFERIGDPKFAQVAYLLKNGDLSDTYIDIYEKDAEEIAKRIEAAVEEHGELSLGSRNLTGYGLAVLGGGELTKGSGATEDTDTRRDTWLWYGMTRPDHAHRDKLQMGINAYGFNFMPDLGYPEQTDTHPARLQWVRNTLSHNTVVVDGEEQSGTYMGTPMHYDADGMVKVIDAEDSSAYAATDIYRRTLVTVDASDKDAYTIDFFRVRGGNEHIYSFHTQSADGVTVLDGLKLTPQVDGSGNYVGTYAGANTEYGDDPNTQKAWQYTTKYPRGYTWLKNVRRDEAPTSGNFSVNFKQTDFRYTVADAKGLNLKFTALNDWTPSSVGFAVAAPKTRGNEDDKPIKYLDYMLIHSKEKDTLFTSVLEPYNGEAYIESTSSVALTSGGGETDDDTAKAVKVKLKSGRIDYIIYATNNNVVYTLTDADNGVSFNFKGFVGVYSVNEKNGALENVYSYVNDGGLIGELEATARYTGSVVSFTEENTDKNFITIKMDDGFTLTDEDVEALAGEFVYIDNETKNNGSYKIEKAQKSGDNIVLDIGAVTNIIAYKDEADPDQGYLYNIENGQTFYIPLSASKDDAPVVEPQENLTTSAGSSINVAVKAVSPAGEKLTYIGTNVPRGTNVNADTGVVTWKPDGSQTGETGFVITVRDESGRTTSISFMVTVYGSTTGGNTDKPDDTTTPDDGNTGTQGGGGGGGGGGTTTPDDGTTTPDDGTTTPDDGTVSGDTAFTDLGNHAWAAGSINALADDGIIKGTSANTYSPANNITRADYALLLVRAFNLESDDTANFADVSASDYFAAELAIARNTGIVNGIGNNKYAPRNTITRQDMMVIIYRALEKLGKLENTDATIDASEYPDYADVAEYAKEAVNYLIANGLVNGKNGRIAPTEYTTRAEVAVLLKRILDYTAK